MKLRGTTVFAVAVTRLGVAALACALILPAVATGAEARPFGIAGFTTQTTEPSAASEFMNEPYLFTQAGGHPFALTTTVTFASEEEVGPEHLFVPTRDLKDMVINLPPGLIADPQAVSQCSMTEEHCQSGTQVGSFMLRASLEGHQIGVMHGRGRGGWQALSYICRTRWTRCQTRRRCSPQGRRRHPGESSDGSAYGRAREQPATATQRIEHHVVRRIGGTSH